MVDEQFIKEEIYRKIADNESLKIKDEATFKKKLAQLNVAPVVQSFNSVFEKILTLHFTNLIIAGMNSMMLVKNF